MTRKRSDRTRAAAREAFAGLSLVHPELASFLDNPQKFDTTVKQLLAKPVVPNNLHHREPVVYVPIERRKCISCDLDVVRLYRQQGFGTEIPSFLAAGARRDLVFDPTNVNVAIVVAGGSAPGTNAVIHWIVKRHQSSYGLGKKGNIYGFIRGFRGLSRKGEINIRPLTVADTEQLMTEPGCLIGMSRYRENINVMVDTLRDLSIDILYVIGGDGTLEAAHKLSLEIEQRGLRIAIAGIPKTIDNDVVWCWSAFGFDTATNEAAKAIRTFHANVKTHGRVGIMMLYGGHAGFLAANAALASGVTNAVVIPEEPFSLAALIRYVERLISRQRNPLTDHALVVFSEGLAWSHHFRKPMVQELRRQKFIPTRGKAANFDDLPSEHIRTAFLNVISLAFNQRFAHTPHAPVITEPRSLISSVGPTAYDIRYCQRLAYNAVDSALAGYTDFMSSYWLTEYVLVPLHLVAGRHKELPVNGAFWSMVRAATGQPDWS